MTSITEPLALSLLRAPIAAIDRRALSQAWYSALGFVKTPRPRTARLSAASKPDVRSLETGTSKSSAPGPRTLRHLRLAPKLVKSWRDARDCEAERIERRTRSPLARRIECSLLKGRHPVRTAITLDVPGGRAVILSAKRGAQVQLIAICPRKIQSQVARALSEARYALARRGIHLDAVTKGGA